MMKEGRSKVREVEN